MNINIIDEYLTTDSYDDQLLECFEIEYLRANLPTIEVQWLTKKEAEALEMDSRQGVRT